MPPKKKGAPEAPKAAAAQKKGKREEAPSRDDRIAALITDVMAKTKGRAIIMSADEYVLPYLTKRLPTGLLTLDLELRGGFPAGGISQIIGRKNAGKSLIAWLMIKQLQFILGKKMKVLLAMTELPADRDQARKVGVKIRLGEAEIEAIDNARRHNNRPELTEEEKADMRTQIGTIDEVHAIAVEDFYDIILRCVEENMYHMIIIDSIGNALASAEQENASTHDKTYGGTSAPNTTFLKKLTNLLTMKTEYGEVRDACIIGINQVRDNIKDPNKKYKAPGGNGLEHAKLVDLYMESGGMIGDEVPTFTMTGDGMKTTQRFKAIGKQVNWVIEKGKAGMHEGARGSYVYDFRINNVDMYTDTIIAGVQHGIIEVGGGGYYRIPNPNQEGAYLMEVRGKENLIAALAQDAADKAAAGDPNSFMNYIREMCFKKLDINIDYSTWVDQ